MMDGTTTRSVRRTVRFESSFTLRSVGCEQPAGDYLIETDEELIEGISRLAYRRLATHLHLPSRSQSSYTQQMVVVDPVELEAALLRDQHGIVKND
jgi:hypothetical protein